MSVTSETRVGVIGASGYGGGEMVRLLAGHPHARLTAATASGERAGRKLADLFPSLRGTTDIECEEFDADPFAAKCNFAFLALGHGKGLDIVPQLLQRGVKVVDIGADFRLRDAAAYKQWYKLDHTAPAAQKEAVYGLPEWQRECIRGARLVANPGCYPTSAILALAPFVAADVIDRESIIVDSASGTSGAGRSSFGIGLHYPEHFGDFRAYNIAGHRHTPEIEQGLADAAAMGGAFAEPFAISFTAHLLPIARGILSTCYAKLRGDLSTAEAHALLLKRYEDEPFVRVSPLGETPQIKYVAGSNFCDIGVVVDARTRRLVVVSALDNLVKGAAGQAMQNMNLMSGYAETDGLSLAPLFP